MDHADGLALVLAESEFHDVVSACRVVKFTLDVRSQRKSRDFELTVRLMWPILSATTVIAPLVFCT
ncbi:hypothetical protein ABH39_02495 [Mycobacterium haemophilum]|uniref:Uncharacterized protein n=1 Tax=Mycobacterium haemophilum TaxID=29311 RepID=A0A0I9Y2E7_9MYCO|nr:hypothetical protein ABH39_02495 [Mycobacterium haemophilum]KLO39220.1 hypothetical protein ABH38_02495 [Mycobacterium haemophilum]